MTSYRILLSEYFLFVFSLSFFHFFNNKRRSDIEVLKMQLHNKKADTSATHPTIAGKRLPHPTIGGKKPMMPPTKVVKKQSSPRIRWNITGDCLGNSTYACTSISIGDEEISVGDMAHLRGNIVKILDIFRNEKSKNGTVRVRFYAEVASMKRLPANYCTNIGSNTYIAVTTHVENLKCSNDHRALYLIAPDDDYIIDARCVGKVLVYNNATTRYGARKAARLAKDDKIEPDNDESYDYIPEVEFHYPNEFCVQGEEPLSLTSIPEDLLLAHEVGGGSDSATLEGSDYEEDKVVAQKPTGTPAKAPRSCAWMLDLRKRALAGDTNPSNQKKRRIEQESAFSTALKKLEQISKTLDDKHLASVTAVLENTTIICQ